MVKIFKHHSGMNIIYDHQPDAATVGINLCVEVGSLDEDTNERGISHFIEHVVFTGTKRRTKEQLTYDVEKSGASINAYTSTDETRYTTQCLSTNFDLCLSVICDMVTGCIFLEDQVENERSIILQEISDGLNRPTSFAYNRYYERAFKNRELETSIIGTTDIVSKLTKENLQSYYKKHYTSNKMSLSISGNIGIDSINSIVDEYFTSGRSISFKRKIDLKATEEKNIVVNSIFNQDCIIWGYNLGKVPDLKDKLIIDIVNTVLGGGMSSILFKRIRDDRGLVYGIGSFVNDISDNYDIVISMQCESDRTDTIYSVLDGVISELKNINQDDLDSTKNRKAFSMAAASESKSSLASRNLNQYRCYETTYSLDHIKEVIDSITLDDCRIFVDKFLSIDPVKFLSKGRQD